MAKKVIGDTRGLKANQIKRLERLFRRRVLSDQLIGREFAHQLTDLSEELHRKIGVLLDRNGQVRGVMLGDAHRVYLPDVGRHRAGKGRLRGIRLVVTALPQVQGEVLITKDERTDLTKLRLDAVVSLEARPDGHPGRIAYAHLMPRGSKERWREERFRDFGALKLDFESFIKALESELERTEITVQEVSGDPAVLVHLDLGELDAQARLQEMKELCATAGVSIVHQLKQKRPKPDPRFLIGSGKLEELELLCLDHKTELVIFDRDLSPKQTRAISERTDLKVVDRTQLILDIFAQRATSHDGKLQVELAQLKYTLPKLIQRNTAMSRLTGGIGGRGPGETKLEINRRRARDRINRLEKELKKLAKRRQLKRARRGARAVPVISLVGYTNAGKSTLLNALTNAKVFAENKLFATLDPTSRRLRFPSEREVVLTDTVGFIRDLPKDLVAAFKATLEELHDADLLVHVVDVASPDLEEKISAVRRILDELGLAQKEEVLVFNKDDLLPENEASLVAHLHGAVPVSALKRASLKPLLRDIDDRLWRRGKHEPAPHPQSESEEEVMIRPLEEAEEVSMTILEA